MVSLCSLLLQNPSFPVTIGATTFSKKRIEEGRKRETDMPFSDPNEQGGISFMSSSASPYSGRRRYGGCLIGVLLILIVVAGGLGFWFWHTHYSVTLSVGTRPSISGTCVGTALFQAGPANQVTFTGDIPPYTQNSSTNTITLGDGCWNITVTVPSVANIDIWATEGITVHGVSGTMNLQTSSGSRIDMEQVTLEGQSKIDADASSDSDTYGGPIVLNGSLAPGSATTVSDQGDTINMTLSQDTSCQLDISGWPSQITSNIPGVQMPADQTSDVLANIGSNPSAAKLMLEVDETAIALRKEP
jgi:hypothetical protein